MSDKLPRINKYLADRGLCSRREAEVIIQKGWVKINGEILQELGYRVKPTDQVKVDEKAQDHLNKKLTLIIHKPLGYVSAQAEEDYKPAIRLTTPDNFFGKHAPKILYDGFAPAGRLDIDSTGLLILTQDGKIAKSIIGPDADVEKEYVVLVNGDITKSKIDKLTYGLALDGKRLKRAVVDQEEKQKLRFVLKEGRKRQLRRMCELVDLEVTSLRRVRIGMLKLGPLPLGQWRLLKKNERIV